MLMQTNDKKCLSPVNYLLTGKPLLKLVSWKWSVSNTALFSTSNRNI